MTSVYTSWKRVFIERDRMFRKGGVLARNYGATGFCGGPGQPTCCGTGSEPDCNQVDVYSWAAVSKHDKVLFFDEAHPFEKGGAELREILHVGSDTDGIRRITLSAPLKRNYLASKKTPGAPFEPTFDESDDGLRHCAGFGYVGHRSNYCDLSLNQINAADSCFYDADMRGVAEPFGDAFVEFVAPRAGMTAIPYVDEEWFDYYDLLWFVRLSATWFEDIQFEPSGLVSRHNYFHLMGASALVQNGTEYYLGITQPHYDVSYIYRASIEHVATTAKHRERLCQHTTVHELGHQFSVNGCTEGHHDERPSWCDSGGSCDPGAVSPQHCVMDVEASLSDRWDVSNRFCTEDLLLGDPNCTKVPAIPADTAIRTQADPN